MRELVLNHASLKPVGWHEAVEFLPDLADGLAELVAAQTARADLRMCKAPFEIRIRGDRSLFDAFLECGRRGWREEFRFLMRLSSKVPVDADLSSSVIDRLLVTYPVKTAIHS